MTDERDETVSVGVSGAEHQPGDRVLSNESAVAYVR